MKRSKSQIDAESENKELLISREEPLLNSGDSDVCKLSLHVLPADEPRLRTESIVSDFKETNNNVSLNHDDRAGLSN